MKNHEGTPNPAAGAAAPKNEMNLVEDSIICMLLAMRPYLSKMDPETRVGFAKGLVNRLNDCLAKTPVNDKSPDRNAAYATILRASRDNNRKKNPDPSGNDLKVPDLDSIVLKDAKLVYICSPFRAKNEEDRRWNLFKAKSLSWFACSQGKIPVTPHLMYPAFLEDDDRDEHCYGMFCALRLLSLCDEVWVAKDRGISEGMEFEIDQAKQFGIPVRYFSEANKGGKS